MGRMRGVVLAVAAVGGLLALAASSASAALPEIGTCVKQTGVKEGRKTVFHGKYDGPNCVNESKTDTGKYEWVAADGAEGQTFESPGSEEPVTLESAKGAQVICKNSKLSGTYTGAKTETVAVGLYECKNAAKEPCQSLRPEETPPTPVEGTILSQALEAELGFIKTKGVQRPWVGWDYKAKSGGLPYLFVFECGATTGTGTKVTIEGSYIGRVVKPVNKMTEEFFLKYSVSQGKQEPESFEGGTKDTLTGTFTPLTLSTATEQLGYLAPTEEESAEDPIEIKATA